MSKQTSFLLKFRGLNAVACLFHKPKAKKAGHTVYKIFIDIQPLLGFFGAYSDYVKGSNILIYLINFQVIHFQRKWRHYSEINKARAQIFMKCWNRYCLSVLEDESRKKKKRYSEQIMKLKDKHIIKYAKEYVLNKNKGFQKAFRLMADKVKS
jgi:hypothetical protein